MKKQIVYCKFIPRVFAISFDLLIISATISKVISLFYNIMFYFMFRNLFSNEENLNMWNATHIASMSKEFIEQFAADPNSMQKFLILQIATFIPLFCMIGGYFVFFWSKFEATPGAMIMGMKVVDADNLETASTKNLIKRYLGFMISIIGAWYILFNPRRMALHDKIANTVVIKK
ncbi:MAG: RDD family protein [Rickettsiaceae bacterium]|nr:RDD family protein [Rickettsiaceae bacterium]